MTETIPEGTFAMEVAPPGDGWILGLIDQANSKRPWTIITRGDGGWHDDEGYEQHPRAWAPLPGPQPQPTGWTPAIGTVHLDYAWFKEGGWSGWMASIERPDGSQDDREPELYNSLEEGRINGKEWADELGLPFVERDIAVPAHLTVIGASREKGSESNVLPFPLSKECEEEERDSDRFTLLYRGGRLLDDDGEWLTETRAMGTDDEWAGTARDVLNCELVQGGARGGKAVVSAAAVGRLLGFAEDLQIRLGIIPPPGEF